ncbi:hypothetical protein F5Y17DRAFT_453758 [Xylariaceae sp. FL0594]|nr:hypothetical protein F5Y17DRAFT_453758 [Xylariaceae sp. FL0594]
MLEIQHALRHLSLSRNGEYFETDRGLLGAGLKSDALSTSETQKLSSGSLFVDGDWITRNGRRLLWLPVDYRATCVAVHGHTLVLGHRSGQVTFLRFAFTE